MRTLVFPAQARVSCTKRQDHLRNPGATVDRLMHHAHVCQTSGDSIRLTQAIAGKGVIPLS
jgi:DNA replication protein DnaC